MAPEAIINETAILWNTDPMTMLTGMYKIIERETGNADPYQKQKVRSNEEILDLYDELWQQIDKSADPLLTACKFAVAGNIIDFSLTYHVDIHETLQHVLETDFAIDHYARFKTAVENASSMLIFMDNAGEIVFDRLLIDTIQQHHLLDKITCVIKEVPILNDATMKDMEQIGLTEYPNVSFLTVNGWNNGKRQAAWMHPEAKNLIREHNVAISKGQANYEVMSELEDVFFLLIAKCDAVAHDTGVDKGGLIFKYNQHGRK